MCRAEEASAAGVRHNKEASRRPGGYFEGGFPTPTKAERGLTGKSELRATFLRPVLVTQACGPQHWRPRQ